MSKVKVLVLRTAGTNCDMETGHAFETAGAEVDFLHINKLIKNRSILSRYKILAIPGGFSYGDDIASGKVLANELKYNLNQEISKFKNSGKLVIGICNGFQVLVKMGLLPDTSGRLSGEAEATLGLNDSGRFEDRWVYLKKGNNKECKCVWTNDLPEVVYMPVAHAEGKFIPRDKTVLDRLKKNGQVVFRYSDKHGNKANFPGNPNGSIDDIAGICDKSGRILGMMPHPERHMTYLQHPQWQRSLERKKEMGIGLHIFKNGVNYFQ